MARSAGDTELGEETVARLLAAAREAAAKAYAPYSGFPVGAAVLTDDGTVISGVNVENASYGLTVCGERVAVFTAAAAGHRGVRAVAVSAPKAPGTTPCGACRQVLNEFVPENGDLIVIVDDGGSGRGMPLADLLPAAFGPRNLDDTQPA